MKPSTPEARVAVAEAHAAAARARLGQTVEVLKRRVAPRSLAHDAADSLKLRGRGVAKAAQRRPEVVAAVVAAFALFLARHRLVRLARRATATSPKRHAARSKVHKGTVK